MASDCSKNVIAMVGGYLQANPHAVRSGYVSIGANLAISEPQKHGSC